MRWYTVRQGSTADSSIRSSAGVSVVGYRNQAGANCRKGGKMTADRRFEGRVALITGAARGMGRAHALGFAREGAALAVCDVCTDIPTAPYPGPRPQDLDETVRLCEEAGATVTSAIFDIRDRDAVEKFACDSASELGPIDILVANAGIFAFAPLTELTYEHFDAVIDINLGGVFNVVKAVMPRMMERRAGRVITIGSTAGLVGSTNVVPYGTAKHAVVGMTRCLALEGAQHGVTANCVCPGMVRTQMLENDSFFELLRPDDPGRSQAIELMKEMNAIPEPWVEPEEITSMVLFLASDAAAHITGAEMKVDLGFTTA